MAGTPQHARTPRAIITRPVGGPIVAAELLAGVTVRHHRYLDGLRLPERLWARAANSGGTCRAAAWWLLLALTLSAGLGMRLWFAFNDDGIYWPDEIYQSLEPAHRVGFGTLPWEFVEGARNWTLPGLPTAGVSRPSPITWRAWVVCPGSGALP